MVINLLLTGMILQVYLLGLIALSTSGGFRWSEMGPLFLWPKQMGFQLELFHPTTFVELLILTWPMANRL